MSSAVWQFSPWPQQHAHTHMSPCMLSLSLFLLLPSIATYTFAFHQCRCSRSPSLHHHQSSASIPAPHRPSAHLATARLFEATQHPFIPIPSHAPSSYPPAPHLAVQGSIEHGNVRSLLLPTEASHVSQHDVNSRLLIPFVQASHVQSQLSCWSAPPISHSPWLPSRGATRRYPSRRSRARQAKLRLTRSRLCPPSPHLNATRPTSTTRCRLRVPLLHLPTASLFLHQAHRRRKRKDIPSFRMTLRLLHRQTTSAPMSPPAGPSRPRHSHPLVHPR